jgi:hypothetical protein
MYLQGISIAGEYKTIQLDEMGRIIATLSKEDISKLAKEIVKLLKESNEQKKSI